MELLQARDHYIIHDKDNSLWCNRNNGSLVPHTGSAVANAWNPVCLGKVEGVIGKVRVSPESDWKLLVIRDKRLVGHLAGGHAVYGITDICIIPLSVAESTENLQLQLCEKHHFGIKKSKKISGPVNEKVFDKIGNSLKKATQIKQKEVKEKEKHEKRILDELYKMFAGSGWFYYSHTLDLTNTVQRNQRKHEDTSQPAWCSHDQRFFWNMHMLQDVLQYENQSLASNWILPIIQGYVQIGEFPVSMENPSSTSTEQETFTVALISRRNQYRAGTRYRRRGVDSTGACANYVETEQIVHVAEHCMSFVQVRGSIPIHWSQAGIKYRPPPKIDKSETETQHAFQKHFEEQLKIYKQVVVVNLINQSGREDIVGLPFLKHIIMLNSPDLTYVTFDFHEYCQGLKFERVAILTEKLKGVLEDMKFTWVDKAGMILEQNSVLRINCMDCLDRTNVVESAVAKILLHYQLTKLGLLLPDEELPEVLGNTFRQLWANNGDTISRQYAGTVALKGDFTRTGERKFSGLMKDGYHSASRYIQKTFKDAYRQMTIDIMLGNPVTGDLLMFSESTDNGEVESEKTWQLDKEENIQGLIDDCKRMLLPRNEVKDILGGWALMDCDEPSESEEFDEGEDVILLLTTRTYYFVKYNDDGERITEYEKIPIEEMQAIEIGSAATFFSDSKEKCLRILYSVNGEEGFFRTLKALPRFQMQLNEDTLQDVIERFAQARAANSLGLKVVEGKMVRTPSKSSPHVLRMTSQKRFTMWLQDKVLPDQKKRIQNSGTHSVTKAFKDVGDRFSKLNPLQKMRFKKSTNEKDSLQNDNQNSNDGSNQDIPDMYVSSENQQDYVNSGLGEDGELLIPSCGILATDPDRNTKSLSNSSVKFTKDGMYKEEVRICANQLPEDDVDRVVEVDVQNSDDLSGRQTSPKFSLGIDIFKVPVKSHSENSLVSFFRKNMPDNASENILEDLEEAKKESALARLANPLKNITGNINRGELKREEFVRRKEDLLRELQCEDCHTKFILL
ncbi:phosphatidylinositide phosphatase SAC2-like [Anneissia japonica]|uniref:phosphatidylinositide phosphatase SAC2-like n=1 Tax=Anneissia japonica TaxID=1529436 RepID=UPI00142559A4|nr:phosphatidylinositide phosphatase SAC2-like [Anneissia japonica]